LRNKTEIDQTIFAAPQAWELAALLTAVVFAELIYYTSYEPLNLADNQLIALENQLDKVHSQ